MATARQKEADKLLLAAYHALRSYQYGNSATELAEGIADKIQEFLESEDD